MPIEPQLEQALESEGRLRPVVLIEPHALRQLQIGCASPLRGEQQLKESWRMDSPLMMHWLAEGLEVQGHPSLPGSPEKDEEMIS